MGSNVAIRVEGLGKKYVIGHQAAAAGDATLRDAVSRGLTAWARSARDLLAGRQTVAGDTVEEFWALKDVNFEIRHGEVVGIVGKNGAGKSTLLKILSRIIDPTQGRVEMRGRVSSLLEVGTGFHQELTGRENIYLNGAILGMSRGEIRRKFDEIVTFSGIERFLDTPVKRYSSGMYARLAFAVAAHLDPEILIIDEVLAVGDAEFQRKCLGKMHDVAKAGRTVLFVSHSMPAVEQLCSRALCLDAGRITADNDVRSVISEYLSKMEKEVLECVPESDPLRPAELRRITLCDRTGAPLKQVTTADTVSLRIQLVVREARPDLKLAFVLYDARENPLFASCPPDDGVSYPTQPGYYEFHAVLPGALLMPQRYSISVAIYSSTGSALHTCLHVLVFDVLPVHTRIYSTEPNRMGVLQVLCSWNRTGHRAQDGAARQCAGTQDSISA